MVVQREGRPGQTRNIPAQYQEAPGQEDVQEDAQEDAHEDAGMMGPDTG